MDIPVQTLASKKLKGFSVVIIPLWQYCLICFNCISVDADIIAPLYKLCYTSVSRAHLQVVVAYYEANGYDLTVVVNFGGGGLFYKCFQQEFNFHSKIQIESS